MQFAGDHLVTSLLTFNLAVEIGQLAVLVLLLPLLAFLLRHAWAERLGIIILSALVAHTAWHWMSERFDALSKFPIPKLDAVFAASAMRGLISVIIVGMLVWLANGAVRRWIAMPEHKIFNENK